MRPLLPGFIGVLGNSRFTDYIDLDLSRYCKSSLDPLLKSLAIKNHIIVADLFRYNHGTHRDRLDA